ncbi:MAG: alpha/beta hydrolase [Candidatus Zixiibacteriota bacterium]|nr:MAG: alpha/beta hydrolase [candidate division Zixibacteria bacterium]
MFLWLVLFAVAAFAILSFYLYFNQKNMVFFPIKDLAVTPRDAAMDYENVTVLTGDSVKIHAWYVPGDSSSAKVFLFCHGNAGNISHRLETIEFLRQLRCAVMIFDYRGFGRSGGDPSEEGVYADARACYDWLVNGKGITPDDIVIFGRSLGGAVAVDLATRVPCGGLVVESSFTSAADMARRIFPFLPTSMLLRYKFNTIEKIGAVSCPILITHSPEDDIVPYSMGEELFEKAGGSKRFVRLSGGHNDREYLAQSDYRAAFIELLGQM